MRRMIIRFIKDQRGATAIEYGLIIALLSLAIVGGVGSVGNKLQYLWGDNSSRVNQGLSAH